MRDWVLERPISDIDLAVDKPPETVMQALEAAGIKVVPTGLKHGTVTAIVKSRPFELTTLRRDVETDGRHAVVAFTDDWREDAEPPRLHLQRALRRSATARSTITSTAKPT